MNRQKRESRLSEWADLVGDSVPESVPDEPLAADVEFGPAVEFDLDPDDDRD